MKMKPGIRAAVILAGLVLGACTHLSLQTQPVPVQHAEGKTLSGIKYEDTFEGKGPKAAQGDEVTLDYTLWLEDGRRVDSTLDRGVPLTVKIGSGRVRGLDEGLVGVRADGKRKITVPPELGYGAKGVEGMIPPNATLVFDVRVIKVVPAGS